MIERDWYNCYGNGWKGVLTPESFAHPAKVAFGLADCIYQHCLEQKYFKSGDTILDPFFGIGGFAHHALLNGLNVVGVELEEKFVTMAQANLERWQATYGPGVTVLDDLRERGLLPVYGQAVLLQGDSRCLSQVLSKAGGVVSSPPYAESVNQSDGANDSQARIERKQQAGIDVSHKPNIGGPNSVLNQPQVYGTTPGQLGAMRVVSSPPYAESLSSDDPDKRGGLFRDEKRRNDKTLTAEYGDSAGQLGRMRVVSSPPYESGGHHNGVFNTWGGEIGKTETPAWSRLAKNSDDNGYGSASENVGNMGGTDFWTAAAQIMEQVAMVLKPGAVAVWVCKRFVRDKQIVEFSQQWAGLGEAWGFETIEWIRAWLIEDRGTQYDLFGGVEERQVARKSFFRRLYENKYPGNSIDWEDVIIQRKL